MKKGIRLLLSLSFLLVLWANGRTHPSPFTNPSAGNIPEGMYTIVGEASKRCLDVPNSSCGAGIGLQTFDCDSTEASNNQKFNIVSDGSSNYTIRPVHSDLCLEVMAEDDLGRIPVQQSVCVPGKTSQTWAMSQYGNNLEIRDVGNNKCLDIMRKAKGNYGAIYQHQCANGTNQRWRLRKTTLNVEKGVICQASPAHPEHNCSGVNDQQKQVHLGKTLTKGRCEEVCAVSKMVSCRWEGSQ